MKKLLVLTVALCLLAGTAVAKEATKQDVKMIEDSHGLTSDTSLGLFGVAQAGTSWIGWQVGGTVGYPGVWDFDDRGTVSCPFENDHDEYIKNGAYAQGWTSEDVYAQKGIYWHAEDYTAGELACSTGPLSGNYSGWCGRLTTDLDPTECFNAAPGYGHNWSQWMCKTVTIGATTPVLKYKFVSDSEPGFDYAYVFIDGTNYDCGVVTDETDTLRCYTGPHNGNVNIDLTNWLADPNVCDTAPSDGDYSGDSVKVCFVAVSDAGWDDQDGGYDTCDGLFNVDDIILTASTGNDTTDFEGGVIPASWTLCGGFSPGDYTAIRNRTSFLNNDVCGFSNCDMDGCVLTFYNPNIAGQYGTGGHYAGDFFKRAWSPVIDMTSYAPRGYVIARDMYGDLPIPNWIFFRYYVSYVQDPGCPAGAWSPAVSDNYVYYVPTPTCAYNTWGFSQYVPTDADSVMIAVSAWNGCNVWEVPCTNGNESPVFDNIMLGVWDLSAPQASLRAVDNYTDSFPEDDTLILPAEPGNCASGADGNTGLIDAANNKSQTGAFLRMADSLVISLDAPDVEAELCFQIRPGPCTDLTDAWWARMGLSPTACELTPTACVRMDTAFAAGDGDTASSYETQVTYEGYFASMIHEDDGTFLGEGEEIFPDSLFTPGTQINYYIRTSYENSGGPYAYLPTTADENDIATWYEVEVLPNRCVPDNCLLYCDYYNRGAQAPIEAALTQLGRTWDRFDLRAESSHQANGVGNRLLGAGKYRLARGPIGPSNSSLQQYTVMLINSGHFDTGTCFSDGGTGSPDDPSNDIGFLDAWMNEGRAKGLWLSGDNIASDFATATSGPKPNFLNTTMSASLVASSYRDFVGHPVDASATCRKLYTHYGYTAADNYWDTLPCPGCEEYEGVYLYGSACPERYDYDVLDYGSGTAITGYALQYDRTDVDYPPSGLAASIYHIFPAANSPYDSVRTIIDGFSMHALRGCTVCSGDHGLLWWLRDVLGDDAGDLCYMYDRDAEVQYCPPRYPEQYVGVEQPGRTYANALFQNYPNPFRSVSGTTIHYSVAKAGVVQVRIFDVAGRLVNTIADRATPGSNFVVWDGKASDGRSVASGVYFYQIKTDGFSDQRKMLLVN
jgi:hypothetical protein